MTFEIWLGFVLASIVVVASPGPTILLVLGDAMAHKQHSPLPTVAGVASGDITTMGLCLIGIGALIATAPEALDIIRLVGAGYVIYLAGRTLWAARKAGAIHTAQRKTLPQWRRFYNAWLITALNPKAILFFIAFAPQFINADSPYAPQAAILLVTYVALAFVNAWAYAAAARKVATRLESPRTHQLIEYTAGSLLLLAGILMLVL